MQSITCLKFPVTVACIVLICGCANLDRREVTWQVLHAVDVAQTLNAAGDPCYRESNWATRRLIGSQPSDAEVIAWGAGSALLHWAVTEWLRARDAPTWVQRTWGVVTIGAAAYTVAHNHREGIRPWGDNTGGCGL
jgi:hypothetical protein